MNKQKITSMLQMTYAVVNGNEITTQQAVLTEQVLSGEDADVAVKLFDTYRKIRAEVGKTVREKIVKNAVK